VPTKWAVIYKEKKMTSKKLWAGILGILLVFSFSLVGCDHDSGGGEPENPFAGTWVSAVQDGISRKIIMKDDKTWEFHQSETGDTAMDTRGTYSYQGQTATALATELYMEGSWVSTAGQPTNVITVTATIQNDGKMEVTAYDGTFTYTKQ
jgi:hypothetical protein